MYKELTKVLDSQPEDDWMGQFTLVRDVLVTGCYLLRAARSGEPLSISAKDIEQVIAIHASLNNEILSINKKKVYYNQCV